MGVRSHLHIALAEAVGLEVVPREEAEAIEQRVRRPAADVAGERQVQGIPCRPLIEQGGSLHCITMQLPEGVLA